MTGLLGNYSSELQCQPQEGSTAVVNSVNPLESLLTVIYVHIIR